jgi:Fe-S oxidoreductase
MCPTFVATGDEALSTRGRANIIRAALEGRFRSPSAVVATELTEVLDTCLACKACVTECPSNVDMAHLKAELRHAHHRARGVPLIDRLIANADLVGRLGTIAPRLANAMLGWRPLRRVVQRALGLDADAPVPPFTAEPFDRWYRGRRHVRSQTRDRVILWDDTWVRYHEPGVGRAAVEVLEAAGFEVEIARGRVCCGRPAASRGLLDKVRRAAEHNLRLLADTSGPIVFLEPSCWSMFKDEYLELEIPGAREVADRCVLFEDKLGEVLDRDPQIFAITDSVGEVAVHGHCHAKALSGARRIVDVVNRLPGASGIWLETGCCGMAGAFGMLTDHRELSRQVAEPLVMAVEALPPETILVATGTSCRHQITDLSSRQPLHLAELLAELLHSPSQRS